MVELTRREGREGNRWVNQRPNGEEVAAWFEAAVKLHDGMEHDDFVSGVTLIQETAKSDEIVGFADDGRPNIIPDVTNVFFTPYPKVETRIDYFNRWMHNHRDEWIGVIEPVAAPDPSGMTVGFNAMKVALPDGKTASLVCYTAQVRVVKRDGHEMIRDTDPDGVERLHLRGEIILEGAPGTKSVPLVDRFGKVDPHAVAKAQTGGVGRALGMAGVLVIPGAGVATAEDMQEAQSQGQVPGVPAAAPEAGAPPSADPDVMMRARAVALIGQLSSDYPEDLKVFQAWSRERGFKSLAEIGGVPLKGIVKKLEKTLDAAQQADPKPQAEVDLSGAEE